MMDKVLSILLGYVFLGLFVAGWFDIFGPEYTWWNFIYVMGN